MIVETGVLVLCSLILSFFALAFSLATFLARIRIETTTEVEQLPHNLHQSARDENGDVPEFSLNEQEKEDEKRRILEQERISDTVNQIFPGVLK